MTVRVAIPVFLARLRVVVDVGIHWNALDRLLLWALRQAPRTATALANEVDLPPRLVNEMVFKLMRFGWVEMAPDGLAFRATVAGDRALHVPDGLPSIAWPDRRTVRAIIEPVAGRVFPAGEVWVRHRNDVKEIAKEHDLRELVLAKETPHPTLQELDAAAQACLLNADEEFVRILPERSRTDKRFLVVTVHDEEVDGLPADAPTGLMDAVRNAARRSGKDKRIEVKRMPAEAGLRPVATDVAMSSADVVLDGGAHRELIGAILRGAHHRVVLHSTFLSLKGFEALRQDLRAAVNNGAVIDILYGADRDEKTREQNRAEALKIAKEISIDTKLGARVRMHVRSTQSHAKMIVADAGTEQSFVAVVGSCNWLSTPYRRVEASVVIRDGRIASQLLHEICEMCFATIRNAPLVGELDQLAERIGRQQGARQQGEAQVRLVLGDEHGHLMRQARDEARNSIWVGADRFGQAAEARALIPMMAAGRAGVTGRVLFSRSVSPLTEQDLADLTMEAAEAGVQLSEVAEEVLHGKFLLWDDDNVVITSLNWSSAGTRRDNPWGEIGVHVRLPGVGRAMRPELEESLQAAQAE
jgi:cardiolipin synthase A/B